jgi:hypothetical protein
VLVVEVVAVARPLTRLVRLLVVRVLPGVIMAAAAVARGVVTALLTQQVMVPRVLKAQ